MMNALRMVVAGMLLLALGQGRCAAGPLPLKVLYAGNPGSSRARDFVTFLGRHFAKVGTAHYGKVTAAELAPYDVVIFDWTSLYKRDGDGAVDYTAGTVQPPVPPLPEDYAKATVLVGGGGGLVTFTRQLKLRWH
jgi:hypothetical protein